MTGPVRPFASGMQAGDWMRRNCYRCALSPEQDAGQPVTCEIELAIGCAYFGDGTVKARIAERMGYLDPLALTWDCPERQAR